MPVVGRPTGPQVAGLSVPTTVPREMAPVGRPVGGVVGRPPTMSLPPLLRMRPGFDVGTSPPGAKGGRPGIAPCPGSTGPTAIPTRCAGIRPRCGGPATSLPGVTEPVTGLTGPPGVLAPPLLNAGGTIVGCAGPGPSTRPAPGRPLGVLVSVFATVCGAWGNVPTESMPIREGGSGFPTGGCCDKPPRSDGVVGDTEPELECVTGPWATACEGTPVTAGAWSTPLLAGPTTLLSRPKVRDPDGGTIAFGGGGRWNMTCCHRAGPVDRQP
jgi:hypothetical protein